MEVWLMGIGTPGLFGVVVLILKDFFCPRCGLYWNVCRMH